MRKLLFVFAVTGIIFGSIFLKKMGSERHLPDLTEFTENGRLVSDDYFGAAFSRELLRELKEIRREGDFSRAGIGKGLDFNYTPEIRSDFIHWLNPETPTPLQQIYFNKINDLIELFRNEFYLPIFNFEAHYAYYPAGSFYKKHLDQFKNNTSRLITCILYLNENWKKEYGGQLRMYNQDGSTTDILPEAGRMVVFRSDLVEHEVLVAHKERYSLTGWMRRGNAGTKII